MIFMFYKEKGFYISLIAGVVAIVAFSVICLNLLGSDTKKDEQPDPQSFLAEVTQTPEPSMTAEPTEKPAKEASRMKPAASAKPVKKKVASPVKSKPQKANLHFNQETGLLWPITGKVIMEYSPDNVIYSKTLSQYRTNPAIVIEAKKGQSVKASAKGVVVSTEADEEIGKNVTMSIGDGYTVKYGQLKDITVTKGQQVEEGQVIGKIAKPTKYYSLEGPNLYYQVKSKNETVNPLVLLR